MNWIKVSACCYPQLQAVWYKLCWSDICFLVQAVGWAKHAYVCHVVGLRSAHDCPLLWAVGWAIHAYVHVHVRHVVGLTSAAWLLPSSGCGLGCTPCRSNMFFVISIFSSYYLVPDPCSLISVFCIAHCEFIKQCRPKSITAFSSLNQQQLLLYLPCFL